MTVHNVQIFSQGDFGRNVAEQLVSRFAAVELSEPQLWSPSDWLPGATTIVAAWRELPREFAFVDEVCRLTGRSWLPIVLEPRHVRVGPYITKATGACYQCFNARQRQHGLLTDIDTELAQLLDADCTLGSSGHLPSHVGVAVHATEYILAEMPFREQDLHRGAPLIRAGLSHLRLTESEVVPVTGCSRCGRWSSPDSAWRSLADVRLPAGTTKQAG